MSLESMLYEEPPVTVLVQENPGKLDEKGMPLHSLKNLYTDVSGRLVLNGATQTAMWMSLGVKADYTLFAFESRIQNGHFIRSADGRLFRVTGTNQRVYAKGNIETYYKYPLEEIKRT